MAKIVCGRCRHEHPIGARMCEACGSRLYALEIRRALGRNPWRWLQATAVGQMAPFFLVATLLVLGLLLRPSPVALRHLLLDFGLVGMLTLGVTFPLMKGHYDFSTGSVAGLAACIAALVSPYGYGLAILCALALGLFIGAINGYLAGRTRIPSAMITLMTGAMALQLVLYFTGHFNLEMQAPELQAVGEATLGGLPVILGLFVVALLTARLLFAREIFAPVGQAANRTEATERAVPAYVLAAFVASGLMAGLAGLLVASSNMALIGPMGQMIWLLTPLTAALIGGGSVSAGLGNLRTATIGAAAIALLNWLVTQLRMPIAGPIVEAPLLLIGLLADRWQNMTAYMIAQARRGNLLALPEELQLPMIVRVGKPIPWPLRLASAIGLLLIFGVFYVYFAFYVVGRVPEGTALITETVGTVQVARRAGTGLQPATIGEKLYPGDLVVTGRASEALLRFHDQSELRLAPNSELLIQELSAQQTGGLKTALRINIGGFFAKVRRLVTRDSSFTVHTPLLTLGVRGTAFELQVSKTTGQVAVTEGAVSLKRAVKVEELFGLTRWAEDERTVEAGKRAQAGAMTLIEPLPEADRQRLAAAAQELQERSLQQRLTALRTRAPKGLWVFIIIGYLIFLLVVKPEPPRYIPEVMRQRAEYFASRRQRTAADSPRSALLAQLYARTGQWDQARAEIQSIIEHDPHSVYGEWARRFLIELERERRRQSR